MASLKDLRNRIASVKATQKITKAMQMVAAAKLRRAQEAAEAARPYSERMGAVLANITQAVGGGGDAPALMTGTGKDDVHLLVVCTAERGLCGGFNSQIARLARDHIRRLLANGKQVKIICVGKKGYDILRRDFAGQILDRVDLREVRTLGFVNADGIAKKVIGLFNDGQFDVCTLFYSQFKSVISQVPTAQQIIPAASAQSSGEAANGAAVYEYEPEPGEILSDLIPRNIAVQIFRALLENAAGEMGAKMSAMDSATRNAGDMINRLSITYNRQRQAQITKELIEIISGAEAL
ncbi:MULTISPECIES: F0F1 ATP synthase subunit gamma [Phyllobacteriaceae]|jgi:F-type H+-transporting ATPase subunit gamma|uniref:ATP synthase gamma chain n=1 Tax=Mesorhizobium hungaricum TaxID=1566387 RepID=A0A1C2DEX1_9HYPH|nr:MULTISPECIES: F0F1 ATP synthase subunit gamma [Mesorhizobium]MBN9232540.1 F0F1 ATP synthase subunit gamma [Mesorhizobium sp.]MDQ0330137.1 F-type H+-transporting ATPase subunit gamma [Mesorhizobium sp. YL-MeA3-2017]OCX13329.1 F0F1 ATP synthase subunit gamma [Mesorhizobium hungaricum]